jgi:surfeit locus 1 family protein
MTASRRRLFAAAACVLLAAMFCALALWQWQRLQWKEALLARVACIDRETPSPAPGPQAWAGLRRADDEYRALALQGRFDPAREQLVLASTVLGRGHWVMTPLLTDDGWWVWVNRGFVDDAHRDAAARPAPAPAELAKPGLLRLSERPWLPGLERASRDVVRLSAAAGLPADQVAPYFVDARQADGTAAWPRAGLTVLSFANRHLGYALTWAALALAACAAAAIVWRHGR